MVIGLSEAKYRSLSEAFGSQLTGSVARFLEKLVRAPAALRAAQLLRVHVEHREDPIVLVDPVTSQSGALGKHSSAD